MHLAKAALVALVVVLLYNIVKKNWFTSLP